MSIPGSYLKMPVDQALGQASVDLYNYLIGGSSSQPEAPASATADVATPASTRTAGDVATARSAPQDATRPQAVQGEAAKVAEQATACSELAACNLLTHLSSPQDASRALQVQKEAAYVADSKAALPDTSKDEEIAKKLAEEELQNASDRALQDIKHDSKKAKKEEKEARKELKRLEKTARKEETRRHHSHHNVGGHK